MCVEYSGSDAVIPLSLCAFPGRMIMNNSLARLRQPVPPTFGVVKNHNNPSNAGIDFDQSAALRLASSGLFCSRMADLGEEEFGLAVSHQGYPHCRCRCPHDG